MIVISGKKMEMTHRPIFRGPIKKKNNGIHKIDFHETIKYSDINVYLLTGRPLHDILLSKKKYTAKNENRDSTHVNLYTFPDI